MIHIPIATSTRVNTAPATMEAIEGPFCVR
jgi:hypothetical protein